MAEKQLVYLYCVANDEPASTGTGDAADDLHLLRHRGFYAVFTKVPESEFGDEGLKRNMVDLEWLKTRAKWHERVIEQVMTDASVIPFKFGTLFNNADSLKAMLDEYDAEFREILSRLGDKEEWGVKIYCDMGKVETAAADDEPEILEIEDQIKSSTPGKAFFLEKKRAELLAQSANAKINEFTKQSFQTLKELSVEARINKVLPREVTERQDDMVLNSAFLVGKDDVSSFVHTADALKLHCENNGFSMDCTGPWPPYNFCGLSRQEAQSA